MGASDAGPMRALYGRLSEDDRYRRFFSYCPPSDRFVDRMASVGERGGFGVVASVASAEAPAPSGVPVPSGVPAPSGAPPQPATGEIVSEASFSLLPGGDAELGITVDARARGWLGPYLLDILVDEAARRRIPNLQAEVLAANRSMNALLAARGSAVLDYYDCPSVIRLVIGTAGRSPAWPVEPDRLRLVVESPAGRWRAIKEARRAGFVVMICPAAGRKLARCPALHGTPCPLAGGADVILDAEREERAACLLAAHRDLHPGVPVYMHTAAPDRSNEALVQGLRQLATGPPGRVVTLDPGTTAGAALG